MFAKNTDKEWEKWGATEEYFAVIGYDEFRKTNLTDDKKAVFFKSGQDHVAYILKMIKAHINPQYNPKQVLDFGCGVGRLVVALAEIAEHVIGLDVSESMLNEAKRNCESRSIRNVEFLKSDDDLSSLEGKYDLIHSFIVFQHIPVKRGERIFEKLLSHLEDGGICVAHFTYAKSYDNKMTSFLRPGMRWIKKYIPFAMQFSNIIRGRPSGDPGVQMNTYDLNRLSYLIQKNNVTNLYVEYSDHEGELGVLVFFQKPKKT